MRNANRFTTILRRAAIAILLLFLPLAAQALELRIAVLRIDYPHLAPISRYDLIPEDSGFAGADLAQEDNATTGQFLGHEYIVEKRAVSPEEAEAAMTGLQEEGFNLFVVLAQQAELERLADLAGPKAMLINALAPDMALRDDACRANLLHVAPSNGMLADAVAQFALWKKWDSWFLIEGSNPADTQLADAYRNAATKFGAQVTESRVFEDTGGARRTDTGHVQVQKQIPVFTQEPEDHDVVITADASDVFAPYLPYHTWEPRPVLGSGGLRPVSFHGAHEAWGATQFQRRFEELTQRRIQPADYQTWLGLRVIGEAVTRTESADVSELRDYILSENFELAAFKGQKVTFRTWNGQLRQPILLYDGRLTVSVSPQEGFLHQRSPLDSLGLDQPESACTAFN